MQIQDGLLFPSVYVPMLATVERQSQHPHRPHRIGSLPVLDGFLGRAAHLRIRMMCSAGLLLNEVTAVMRLAQIECYTPHPASAEQGSRRRIQTLGSHIV